MSAVPWPEALRTWARVAALSFGGPAGQIAVMHRILVDEKRWVGEARFLHALSFCMLLPGPEAQQLATYLGWSMHGTRGAFAAGGLFILPGLVALSALSILYVGCQDTHVVQGLLFGLKAAVLAIVVQAVQRIGKRTLRNRALATLAVSAFVALFLLGVPFPLVVLGAGLIGLGLGRRRPEVFAVQGHGGAAPEDLAACGPRPPLARFFKILTAGLLLWLGPVAALLVTLGPAHVLSRLGLFFSEAAVVTFGGAYAVLAFVAQQAVETHGWLSAREMLDGLGMAETTPGPLIMVVQFVGFLAGYRHMPEVPALLGGGLASLLVVWVTFVPSFLWIFLGAPYVERLRTAPRLSAALAAITAAVVGVVANLAVWLALHTWFGQIDEARVGPLRLLLPRWGTLDPAALALAVLAGIALLRLRWGMLWVLAAACGAGAGWTMLGG